MSQPIAHLYLSGSTFVIDGESVTKKRVQSYLKSISPHPLYFSETCTEDCDYIVFPDHSYPEGGALRFGIPCLSLTHAIQIFKKNKKTK